ncbi:speckle-type POZ protein [Nephila pilipes]|uniref:Speckle-type POZ protein n=1 Tax=Nephila pilipes TaxID=299642 RepID=A0A8X6P0N4_NEPPI|nr:speckle-type POZ protein [Nephila pilipes]
MERSENCIHDVFNNAMKKLQTYQNMRLYIDSLSLRIDYLYKLPMNLVMTSNTEVKNEGCITFLWNIENFSYLMPKTDAYIKSPEFQVDSIKFSFWSLYLYPTERNENYFPFSLAGYFTVCCDTIQVEWEFAFLAEDGSVLVKSERKTMSLTSKIMTRPGLIVKIEKQEPQIEKDVLLSQDTLRTRWKLWRTDGKPVSPETFFARTVSNVITRGFLWDIKDFSTLEQGHKVDFVLDSKSKDKMVTFSLTVSEGGEMKIGVMPYKWKENRIKLQFWIKTWSGNDIYCRIRDIFTDKKNSTTFCLFFTKKYLLDNLYLKSDVLTLFCSYSSCNGEFFDSIRRIDTGITSLSINPVIVKPSTTNWIQAQSINMVDLKEDFGGLYVEGMLSDVKIRGTSRTFHVHKLILSARSPVFRKMLTANVNEKNQEYIDIQDTDDNTLHLILQYMYTNNLEGLEWGSALRLYAAALKYEIVVLKNKCSFFLKCYMCASNVCEVLIFADLHSDNDLKKTAQDYILKHESDIYYSNEWIHFVRNHGTLAAEVIFRKYNVRN